jgi:hypothetical protein
VTSIQKLVKRQAQESRCMCLLFSASQKMQTSTRATGAAVVIVLVAPERHGSQSNFQEFELRSLSRLKVTPTYMTVSGARYL